MEDLSTKDIISEIVSGLKRLKASGSELLPVQIPEVVQEKYKFGMQLTNVIKNIGYRGRVAYDTFLYGNEVDLKKILLFIQELFPLETNVNPRLEEERVQLIKQVQTQINVLEVPASNAYWKKQASLLANASESERHALWKVLQKISIQRGKKKGKPPLPPKPTGLDGQKSEQTDAKRHQMEEKKKLLERLKEEIGNTQEELDSISSAIEKGSVKLQTEKVKLSKECANSRTSRIARELLGDFEGNRQRLEGKTVEIARKRETVKKQWQEIKEGLISEREELRLKRNPLVEELERERQTVRELRGKISSTQVALGASELSLKSLEERQKAVASSKDKIYKRNHYTKKILEFNRVVEQQKTEANKVLEDIRTVQRSLNSIAGKLTRGFAEAEELLFQTAIRNVSAKPCYKYLTEIHFTMADIVTFVQEKGSVDRETDTIEGEVHFEKRKEVKEKYAKISKDIANLKTLPK